MAKYLNPYEINTDKCTHIFLYKHFINTIHNSKMFQSLKGHLQGVQLIHSSSVIQQNGSSLVKFNLVSSMHARYTLS